MSMQGAKPRNELAVCAVAVLLAGLLVGCGARKEYGIAELRVDRSSWDSLEVLVSFTSRTTIGRPDDIAPDELTVLAFSEEYDTLYAGTSPDFHVADARLGDREGVILEICGRFGVRWICAQEGVRASPKRVTVSENIVYPLDDSFDRGRYDLDVRIERRRFEGEGWEEIDFQGSVSGYMEAYVEGAPEEPVRIPYTRTSGRFDLSRLDNYHDFRFYLDSQLMDHQEAEVRFLVYGSISGPPELLTTASRTVSAITSEERLANVQGFVRQVARHLVDDLSSFFGGRRSVAYVNAWHFDQAEDRYVIDMEVAWRGSFFDNREYRLEGELTVDEDGAAPVFRMLDGNRRGVDRWNQRMRGEEVRFSPLEVEYPPERYRPRGRRLSAY